jgi:hypothetical protein
MNDYRPKLTAETVEEEESHQERLSSEGGVQEEENENHVEEEEDDHHVEEHGAEGILEIDEQAEEESSSKWQRVLEKKVRSYKHLHYIQFFNHNLSL